MRQQELLDMEREAMLASLERVVIIIVIMFLIFIIIVIYYII